MGSWNQRRFLFFFHMDIYHNENTASCLEWILEPISKISWLHLCISISRLTILFPVADACFFHTLPWCDYFTEPEVWNVIYPTLFILNGIRKLYFLCISSTKKKKNPTDTCNFFQSNPWIWELTHFPLWSSGSWTLHLMLSFTQVFLNFFWLLGFKIFMLHNICEVFSYVFNCSWDNNGKKKSSISIWIHIQIGSLCRLIFYPS